MEAMNLLFTRFPLESIPGGGAETQTISLMRGLRDHGHTVKFAGSCPALLQAALHSQFSILNFQLGPPPVTKWLALSFLWRAPFMRKKLSTLLAAFDSKLEAIVMLSLTEKLLLTDLAVRRGIKVFWIEHDRIGPWLTYSPWLWLLRRQSELATTITVSELSRKKYLELGWSREGTVAIPNGVAMSDKRIANSTHASHDLPLPATHSQLHIGCVSRLSKEKGVDLLIEAVKDMPDVKLTIVGKGKLCHHDTNIIPFVEDITSFYHGIDLLVLPSRDHDPFGLVAAEAMMCGIPVIVTNQCGIAGYLKDGVDAVVVKAGSSEALRIAIERCKMQETRDKLSIEGAKTAKQLFTVDRMIQTYEKLFLQS